jgi:hypothetical protein
MLHVTRAPDPGPFVVRDAPGASREWPRLVPLLVLFVAVCALVQPSPDPVRDEPALLAAASRLLDGHLVPVHPTLDPRAYLWHGPGLVAVLAPLVALDLPLYAIRFVEPVVLGAAVLLFHRLLRLRLGPRAALLWTYAFGLYVPFYAVLPEVHKEPLSALLVIVAMLATTRALAAGAAAVIAAGLSLTALTMVRMEYGWVTIGLLVVALAAWALRRHSDRARRAAAIAAIGVAGCLPWLAYTQHLTGKPLYWGSSSGLSLFWMSPTGHGETGSWHEPSSVFTDPELARFRPLFAHLRRLDPVASDDELRERAVANIRAHPAAYARNLAANTSRLFFAAPMRPALSASRVGIDLLFNGALLAGLAWALAVARRRRLELPAETLPIAAFAVLAIAIHLPPSASPRMLLPVVPALLWLVAQVDGARRAGRTS